MSTHFILHTLNSLHTELSTHSDHNSKCIHMYTLTHKIVKGEDTQLADIPIAFWWYDYFWIGFLVHDLFMTFDREVEFEVLVKAVTIY